MDVGNGPCGASALSQSAEVVKSRDPVFANQGHGVLQVPLCRV